MDFAGPAKMNGARGIRTGGRRVTGCRAGFICVVFDAAGMTYGRQGAASSAAAPELTRTRDLIHGIC